MGLAVLAAGLSRVEATCNLVRGPVRFSAISLGWPLALASTMRDRWPRPRGLERNFEMDAGWLPVQPSIPGNLQSLCANALQIRLPQVPSCRLAPSHQETRH